MRLGPALENAIGGWLFSLVGVSTSGALVRLLREEPGPASAPPGLRTGGDALKPRRAYTDANAVSLWS